MSGIPKQVEEAADLALQVHEQMFNYVEPEEEEEETETSEEPEPSPDDDEDVVDVPDDDDIEELKKFKARYLTLKGKYDAEVPRLSHELRDLKQSVFEKIEKMTTQRENPAEVSNEPAPEDLMMQFAETYGEEFTDSLKKLIAAEARKYTQPVQEAVTSVEEIQMKTAQTNFVNYLDNNLADVVPDWREKWSGNDPNFIEFLKQPDPSGLYTMGQLAEMYNNAWDADKLISIFRLYHESSAPPAPQSKQQRTPPQKEAMVAPSRTNTHTAPNTESKPIWTQDMIKEFQVLDRQGRYEPEVSKAMWDDLLLAMSEGRLR